MSDEESAARARAAWAVVGATFGALLLGLFGGPAIAGAIAAMSAFAAGLEPAVAIPALVEERAVLISGSILGSSAGLLVVAAALSPRPFRSTFRLVRPRAIEVVAAVAGMLALTTLLTEAVSLLGLESRSLEELEALFGAFDYGERARMLGIVALAPGISEELFFRGHVLDRLAPRGRAEAVIFSSLLFGAVHFDVIHSLAAFVMGLFLALCAVRMSSLVPVIVAHVANNAVAAMFPGLRPSTGLGHVAVIGGASIVLALVGWWLGRSRRESLSSGRRRRRSSTSC